MDKSITVQTMSGSFYEIDFAGKKHRKVFADANVRSMWVRHKDAVVSPTFQLIFCLGEVEDGSKCVLTSPVIPMHRAALLKAVT
jgi:hypothetical protein